MHVQVQCAGAPRPHSRRIDFGKALEGAHLCRPPIFGRSLVCARFIPCDARQHAHCSLMSPRPSVSVLQGDAFLGNGDLCVDGTMAVLSAVLRLACACAGLLPGSLCWAACVLASGLGRRR